MKVLCIGNSCYEITCQVEQELKNDSYIDIEENISCSGGTAGNIAYLLGKWGVETYIASMIGADDYAAKIKKDYENIGVKTELIETSYDKRTGQRLIVLNKHTKDRTVLNIANKLSLKKSMINIEPDVVISDGIDYHASMTAFDKYPNSMSFLVINSFSNEALELGKYVKYIIINKSSAERIFNIKIDYNDSSTLVNLYNLCKQRYNKAEVIITLGERGCIYSINNQVKIMPALKVDVVDSFGAGAIFVGSFAYAMGRNFGLEKSIAYAVISSGLSTTKLTTRLSIPTLTEVSNYYDSKFGVENNPNNNNQPNLEVENVNK